MKNKQFVAKQKMLAHESMEAEMTGPGMNTDSDYNHKSGTGGAGGSPCKFRKREGTLDDKRIITGKHCQANFD